MKKVLAIVLVIGMVACCFAGCFEGSKIIGTWKSTDAAGAVYTFNKGGKGQVTGEILGITGNDLGSAIGSIFGESLGDVASQATAASMSYTIKGKTITISVTVPIAGSIVNTYEMSINDDVLTLTDVESHSATTYTKVVDTQAE